MNDKLQHVAGQQVRYLCNLLMPYGMLQTRLNNGDFDEEQLTEISTLSLSYIEFLRKLATTMDRIDSESAWAKEVEKHNKNTGKGL